MKETFFYFSRKIRLKYHFRNSNYSDASLIKQASTFTPNRGENIELEYLLQPVERINIVENKSKDNIGKMRKDLKSLLERTQSNEIIMKPADKGDIIVLQSAAQYNDYRRQQPLQRLF